MSEDEKNPSIDNLIEELEFIDFGVSSNGGIKRKFKKEIESDALNKVDDHNHFKSYKKDLYQAVRDEVKFKSKARKYSLLILAGISGILFINVFVMIYFNGVWIFPNIKTEIILAMITATFVNLFTIVTLVFKYIFSPTKDLMEHAKDVGNGN